MKDVHLKTTCLLSNEHVLYSEESKDGVMAGQVLYILAIWLSISITTANLLDAAAAYQVVEVVNGGTIQGEVK